MKSTRNRLRRRSILTLYLQNTSRNATSRNGAAQLVRACAYGLSVLVSARRACSVPSVPALTMNVALGKASKFALPSEGGECCASSPTREAILTDVPHRPVRRVRLARIECEGEESAVRAFAPLEIGVRGDEDSRDLVCVHRGDPCAERGRRRDGRPGEFDADRAFASKWVVAGEAGSLKNWPRRDVDYRRT